MFRRIKPNRSHTSRDIGKSYGDFKELDTENKEWQKTAPVAAGRAAHDRAQKDKPEPMAARGRQTDSPSSPTAGAYLEIDTPVPATSGNALVVWTPTRSATEEFYSPHITGTVAKRPVVSNENKEPSSEMGDPSEQAPNGPDDTVPTLSLSQGVHDVPTEDFRALSQIIIIILEAGQRFSQLSGTPPNDPVGAVRHVLRAYEELTNAKSKKLSRFSGGKSKGSKEPEDWERKFKAYEQKLQTCDQKLQESEHKLQASEHKLKASEQKLKASEQKLKVNEKEVSNLTIQRNALRENEIRLERVKEQLKKDLRDRTQGLKAEHAKEVAKWKGKAEKTKAELDESTRQHNYITYQHQESHQREIIRIRGEHKVVLSRAAEAARFESAATDQKHRDALQEKDNTLTIERNERSRRLQLQKDEYDKTLSERQQRYDKQLLEQQQRHDKEKHEQQHRHETGLFEQQQRHATEISALCQQLEDKIKSFEQDRIQMRSDFDARTEHLQRNNESLTGALLRRDHFKGLADSVLRAKFSSLSIKLETISFKADWDTNRESNWPFRGALLHQLCPTDTNKPNVRKLKQRIMHNNLWFILYFYVFSTPFRILGETGKDLDKDWFEEFGGTLYVDQTSEWPPASEESEKGRYETAKSCLEAIQNGHQNSEESTSRRESYAASIRQIVVQIRDLVEQVAPVDAMDEQKFAELIDDAAKLWLEACSQRYRFRVKIPQGAEDIMNRKVDDVSPMILVAKPSLVRCGNSQGQDLMTEEFLSDWAGEVIEYEYVEPIV